MDISPEIKNKLDKLLARVDELIPPAETVRLKPSRSSTAVFDSKLGGVPYFPRDMEYPTVRKGVFAGKPLRFLAQLNFGSLPKLEGFPTEGILQFFAGCTDDTLYGADFDNGCYQNGFRVIYHENVIDDTAKLICGEDMPKFDDGDDYYPFTGEFLLTAEEPAKMPINENDFRFWDIVLRVYNEINGTNITKLYGAGGFVDVEPKLDNALYEERNLPYTRIGGYPYFTQTDPRADEEYSRHTVLLFQSDSESGGEGWENEVCWGDAGVANFFITPEDLVKRDFSHVLYTWDCG